MLVAILIVGFVVVLGVLVSGAGETLTVGTGLALVGTEPLESSTD